MDQLGCRLKFLKFRFEKTETSFAPNLKVEVAKGAGIVALVAEEDQKPVLVCCETFKFNDRSAINALDNHNELGESKVDFDLR